MEILTKRPVGMSFADYKEHLKGQKKWLNGVLQGRLYYKAAYIEFKKDALGNIMEQKLYRNPTPFVGSTKLLRKPV